MMHQHMDSSQEKFRALLEYASIAIVIVDRDANIQLANAKAEEFFGYRREELIGQSVHILVPDAVREALGYRLPHFPLADHYETSDWMYGNLAHDKLVDSGDWHEPLNLRDHRYMSEDIGFGLAFLVSVADWAGVACPVARGLLAIAAAASGQDFARSPRTLAALGLAARTRAELQALLKEGI